MTRYMLAIAAVMLLLAPTASAAARPTYAQLAAQNTTLKRQLATANRISASRLAMNRALTAKLATMTTSRDQALAGLPAAIAAVPLESFVMLVLDPMRNAAQRVPCGDSYYASSEGFISYSFYAGTPCVD